MAAPEQQQPTLSSSYWIDVYATARALVESVRAARTPDQVASLRGQVQMAFQMEPTRTADLMLALGRMVDDPQPAPPRSRVGI